MFLRGGPLGNIFPKNLLTGSSPSCPSGPGGKGRYEGLRAARQISITECQQGRVHVAVSDSDLCEKP